MQVYYVQLCLLQQDMIRIIKKQPNTEYLNNSFSNKQKTKCPVPCTSSGILFIDLYGLEQLYKIPNLELQQTSS